MFSSLSLFFWKGGSVTTSKSQNSSWNRFPFTALGWFIVNSTLRHTRSDSSYRHPCRVKGWLTFWCLWRVEGRLTVWCLWRVEGRLTFWCHWRVERWLTFCWHIVMYLSARSCTFSTEGRGCNFTRKQFAVCSCFWFDITHKKRGTRRSNWGKRRIRCGTVWIHRFQSQPLWWGQEE